MRKKKFFTYIVFLIILLFGYYFTISIVSYIYNYRTMKKYEREILYIKAKEAVAASRVSMLNQRNGIELLDKELFKEGKTR